MDATEQKLLDDLVPVAVAAIGILCPEVPSFIWSALLKAIINGDLSPAAIEKFMEDNDIQVYQEFPTGKGGVSDAGQ